MESFEEYATMEILTLEDSNEEVVDTRDFEFLSGTPSRVTDGMFVTYLKKYGKTLLSKSQKPFDKLKKKEAAEKISQQLQFDKGICYSSQQVLKKVQNLKCRLKTKADVTRTGNRKISLSAAEKELSELMDAIDNPAVNPFKGGIVLASSKIMEVADVDSKSEDDSADIVTPKKVLKPPYDEKPTTSSLASTRFPRKAPQKIYHNVDVLSEMETQETKGLSLEQLQRVVLLKQLKVFETQERLMNKQEKVADLQLKGFSE